MRYARASKIPLLSQLLACLLFIYPVIGIGAESQSNEKHIVFGIAPFMSPAALVKRMAPLIKYLSDSTGMNVVIETAIEAKEFKKRTQSGRYDLILTSPTFSLSAMDQGGFQIVASQKKKIFGHFVVLNQSDAQILKDLKGKLIGAPPRIGFFGQLIQPYLDRQGFSESNMPRVKHLHSHKDVVAALRLGETDASFIVSFMEKHLLKEGHPIRTIHRTQGFPGLTMLARSDMDKALVKKINQSLLSLDQTEEGKTILKKISMPGFVNIDLKQLESVRPYLPKKKQE